MNHNLIYVEEYQQNIPLLLKKNRTGIVHSIFENGVNLRMGNRLIFIGTTKNGRLPFGIHLQKEALKGLISSIYRSSEVSWDKDAKQLIFKKDHLAVSLERGTPYRNIVYSSSALAPSPQSIQTIIRVLVENGERTGGDLDIGQFVIDYLENRQQETEIAQQVCRLMMAIYSNDPNEPETIIRYFLGRGKGLTPSGDDHLVGLLAIQHIINSISLSFIQTLTDILEREMITTDISKEYLLYALNGEFSSPIINILNAILADQPRELEKHLVHLLKMGHSSGVDTAFGMLVGLFSMMKRRK